MTLRDEVSTQDDRNRGDKSKNMREEVLTTREFVVILVVVVVVMVPVALVRCCFIVNC